MPSGSIFMWNPWKEVINEKGILLRVKEKFSNQSDTQRRKK
jgi:hypothetical protein